MGRAADCLTHGELAGALQAIEDAAGHHSFSPEYQSALGEILTRAQAEGVVDGERCLRLLSEVSEGSVRTEPQDGTGDEDDFVLIGPTLLEGFLVGRDTNRPLLVVSWSASGPDLSLPERDKSSSRSGGVVDALSDETKAGFRRIGWGFRVVRQGLPFYATLEETAELQREILATAPREYLNLEGEFTSINLSHLTTSDLHDEPVDVLLIPPVQATLELPEPLRSFAEDSLGATSEAVGLAAQEIAPAFILSRLQEGSRLVWFGYQSGKHRPDETHGIRVAARRAVLQDAEALDVVHFPHMAGRDQVHFVALGGHTLSVARKGAKPCRLRVERARSWIDWFVRLRPDWTWLADPELPPAFVLVEADEDDLPWTPELFGTQARPFRREFLTFGSWATLGSLGRFDSVENHRFEWRPHRAEQEEECGWDSSAQSVRIRAIDADELGDINTGSFDPDPDEGYYELYSNERNQWEPHLLREGDLLFGWSFHGDRDLSSCIAPVRGATVGTLATIEDGIERFVFHDHTAPAVREWVGEFLVSPLGERWARVAGFLWHEDELGWQERWPDFLIPLPSPHLLRAYLGSEDTIELVFSVLNEFGRLRKSILAADIDRRGRWSRLRNLSVRSAALNLLLEGGSSEDIAVRLLHPYPVANALREARILVDPEDRLRALVGLGEVTAGVLAGFWLTLQRATAAGVSANASALLRQHLRRGLTFGGWLQLVDQHLLPEFERSALAPFLDADSVMIAIGFLQFLKEIRNDLSHSRPPCGTLPEEIVEVAEDAAVKAVVALEPLAAIQLLRVEQAVVDPLSGKCHSYTGRVLAGDHPAGWPTSASDPPPPALIFTNHLYLRTPAGAVVPANPMFALEPNIPGIGVGIIDSIMGEGVRYRRLDAPRVWVDQQARKHLPH
jgi:hypothetical protein